MARVTRRKLAKVCPLERAMLRLDKVLALDPNRKKKRRGKRRLFRTLRRLQEGVDQVRAMGDCFKEAPDGE